MGDDARVKVMVVEDDPEVAVAIGRKLRSDGCELESTDDPVPVLARLEAGSADWDVMILDVGLPNISGIDVLKRFREAGSPVSIIMLTGDQTAATATECMRAGAFYYLTKPFRPHELSSTVVSGARHSQLRRQLARHRDEPRDSNLVGVSTPMRHLRSTIERLAGSQDVSVLIRGESGTGKELVARSLHLQSARRGKRFVAINCGGMPESLIDSELFGHAKGAFTGATADRAGLFVEADGGTLFLDEIGDMPMNIQARLLRVLQEGEVRAVGGSSVRKVDVRVISATHVDLNAAVADNRFRQDLYYRLAVVTLPVPPLRDRLDDLPILAAHFLKKHGGPTPPSLSPQTLEVMAGYHWPGNIRELENALQSAIALHHGDVIGPESLPPSISPSRARPTATAAAAIPDDGELLPLTEAKRKASAAYEKRYLERVMRDAKGSVSEAARLAGLDRTNFRRLLQRHLIDPASFR